MIERQEAGSQVGVIPTEGAPEFLHDHKPLQIVCNAAHQGGRDSPYPLNGILDIVQPPGGIVSSDQVMNGNRRSPCCWRPLSQPKQRQPTQSTTHPDPVSSHPADQAFAGVAPLARFARYHPQDARLLVLSVLEKAGSRSPPPLPVFQVHQ